MADSRRYSVDLRADPGLVSPAADADLRAALRHALPDLPADALVDLLVARSAFARSARSAPRPLAIFVGAGAAHAGFVGIRVAPVGVPARAVPRCRANGGA